MSDFPLRTSIGVPSSSALSLLNCSKSYSNILPFITVISMMIDGADISELAIMSSSSYVYVSLSPILGDLSMEVRVF